MRTFILFLLLAINTSVAVAQDDPTQQAIQESIQISQQAIQEAQQSMQQAMDAAADANQQQSDETAEEAQNAIVYPQFTAPPKFSVKAGNYKAPQTVRITDSTRDAIIYYTTDGWTPTKSSPRYRGPVTINSTTTLQAIAIAPDCLRSLVSTARYTLPSASPAAGPTKNLAAIPATSSGTLLPKGTPVPLLFAVEVTSKTAQVGDKIQLTLADDLTDSAGFLAVKKGSVAAGIVTAVNKTGAGGAPGDIRFKVTSLDASGTAIKLSGHALLEGQAKVPNATALIPVAGAFTIFKHGKDAEIPKGTPFTAYVAADTIVPPGT
jgi:hypothetical protein